MNDKLKRIIGKDRHTPKILETLLYTISKVVDTIEDEGVRKDYKTLFEEVDSQYVELTKKHYAEEVQNGKEKSK